MQEKAAGLGVAGIVTHHAEPVVTTHAGWYPGRGRQGCLRYAVAEVSYSVEACAHEEETGRSGS